MKLTIKTINRSEKKKKQEMQMCFKTLHGCLFLWRTIMAKNSVSLQHFPLSKRQIWQSFEILIFPTLFMQFYLAKLCACLSCALGRPTMRLNVHSFVRFNFHKIVACCFVSFYHKHIHAVIFLISVSLSLSLSLSQFPFFSVILADIRWCWFLN